MANFTQWRNFVRRGVVKRHAWVCGTEFVLVEEVVAWFRQRHDPLHTEVVTGGADSEAEIWAALNQYPMPGCQRLVVVRDAQEIKDWDPLFAWAEDSKSMPDSSVVFVSRDADFPIRDGPGRKLEPYADVIKVKGWVVRCTNPNDRDLLAWLREYCEFTDTVGEYLLARVQRDLSRARNVCLSARALRLELTEELVTALTPQPTDDFVMSLLKLDKPAAFRSAAEIPATTVPRVLGLVDRHLELVQELNGYLRRRMTMGEIAKAGIPSFRAAPLADCAKHYDATRVTKCRQVLLAVDSTTDLTGVLEAVVALW